ncbi:MAG: Nucleotide-binding protein UspA family [Candidatus Methanohalarchaeum thermophilum]|uniref:Nucleotide-binding protein UspA family n=1 Tax=Methanohalarchaeum thermophilum TaxID=1903181 RepID=A0A1Q6DW66_METT1|nr:MAG: Nucleotide-binding protein UspA family [Candidatus Methanohalarchaeum thermophilum]
MFSKILVPVSSEEYSKEAIERAADLASKYEDGKLHILYIIEEKMLEDVNNVSDTMMTEEDKKKLKEEIINERTKVAEDVILKKTKSAVEEKDVDIEIEPIEVGCFSDSISHFIDKGLVDLILIGFHGRKYLNYSVIQSSSLPLWLYKKEEGMKLMLVASNLTVNEVAYDTVFELIKKFDLKSVDLAYILDYSKEKDYKYEKENIVESKLTRKEMRDRAEDFVNEFKDKCKELSVTPDVEIIEGKIEKITLSACKERNTDIIVLGDIMKEERLSLTENIDKKIVESIPCSIILSR